MAWVLAASACGGVVLHVDDDAPAGGDGATWATAFRHLQDALALAGSGAGAEIRVAQGTYRPDRSDTHPDGTGDRDASFVLTGDVVVRGGFAGLGAADPDERDPSRFVVRLDGDLLGDDGDAPTPPVLDDNARHVVTAVGTVDGAALDGVRVEGGHADAADAAQGGGLRIDGGRLLVTQCAFVRNRARFAGDVHARGGAVRSVGAVLDVVECTFEDNVATGGNLSRPPGGGAIAASASTVTIAGGAFRRNRADSLEDAKGGSLWAATGAIVSITSTVFEDNLVRTSNGVASGGAIFLSSAEAHLEDVRLVANTARGTSPDVDGSAHGGGIAAWNATLVLSRCRLLGNRADADKGALGGALHLDMSTIAIGDALLAGNAVESWEGSYEQGAAILATDTTVDLTNCTIALNASPAPNLTASGIDATGGRIGIANSVLWSNGTTVGQSLQLAQLDVPVGTLTIDGTCLEGWDGALGGLGNHGLDPAFVDADGADDLPGTDDDDLRLPTGSPCVDAGVNALASTSALDVAGAPRRVDDPGTADSGIGEPPLVDMGAHERSVPACPGDANGSGAVDFEDLLIVLGLWGTSDPVADVAPDGIVDFTDLLAVLAAWGVC